MDPGRFRDYLMKRIKYIVKIKYITIDNRIFALHYRITSTLFLVFSALVMIQQFFGKPIQCIKQVGSDGQARVEQKVVDNYCWIEGTFILPTAVIESIEFEQRMHSMPHPHVALYAGDLTDPDRRPKDEILETTYYQWVPIVLFFQSMAFYLTHYIWKSWEGGKQKNIVNNLFKTVYKKQDVLKHQNTLIEYLVLHRGDHNSYAFRYFICEILNVVHVYVQFAFINWFIGGNYWSYGLDVLADMVPDPMRKMFPTMTKCRYHKFGPSGDVQKYDSLCILPINILNEKLYLILWYWLHFVGVMSILAVIYKILVIGFPATRVFLLHTFNRMVPPRAFQTILDKVTYGDWFLLYLLSKNLDPFHYRDVMVQLSQRLDDERTGTLKKQKSLLDEEVPSTPTQEQETETSI